MKQFLIIVTLLAAQVTLASSWDINTLMSYVEVEEKLNILKNDGWAQVDQPTLFTTYQFILSSSHQLTKKVLIIPIRNNSIKGCIAAEFSSGGKPYPTFQKFLKITDSAFGCFE